MTIRHLKPHKITFFVSFKDSDLLNLFTDCLVSFCDGIELLCKSKFIFAPSALKVCNVLFQALSSLIDDLECQSPTKQGLGMIYHKSSMLCRT